MPSTEHLDQNAPSMPLERERIPNFDLASLFNGDAEARAKLVKSVGHACQDTGFFYVHNTCVSDAVIEQTLVAAKSFFDSPDDGSVKQSVHNQHAGGMKGWGPKFGEPAYQKDTIAHVESFDIGQQLSAELYAALDIDPNIWPDIPGFRKSVLAYYDGITRLGRVISRVFSEILGEDAEFINDRSRETAQRTMRLLHYPDNDTPADDRNVGIAAHTDFECFTIMNQTASGLELTNVRGQWCQAPSDIGTFTIIVGDMLERFSNGHLKATGHRVVNTPWTRYSLILFFAVDEACEVSPLPQFVTDKNDVHYKPITQGEHIRRELERAEAYAEEAKR